MKKDLLKNNGIETLYESILKIIENSRASAYKAVNNLMVQAYWNIGKLIVEEEQRGDKRAEYGEQLINSLSKRLTAQFGKGFTLTNLKYMRLFYRLFEKGHALRDQLSWTHYRLLLKVEKEQARRFYIEETIAGNWSTRTLERQINSLYYERLLMSASVSRAQVKDEAANKKVEMQPKDIIKDPYVIEFLDLKPNHQFYESELEGGLIGKLQDFLLELGRGFAFVGRQYRITTEDSGNHFYIDLVFYNYILKCFLIIDLKTTPLTHQDIGQIDFYVRYFEDKVRRKDDNPTIGLILCTEKDKTIVKYSLLSESKQIFASRYKLYLPTEEELTREMEREKHEIATGKETLL
jgi:predicted nuclease of restriction endonuclease-like (RecB) superfamily